MSADLLVAATEKRDIGHVPVTSRLDQEEALTISDVVAVMNKGRIEQVGTPSDIYMSPATRFVARFIGTTNTGDAEIVGMAPGGADVSVFGTRMLLASTVPLDGRSRVPVTIRPEHVHFGSRGEGPPQPRQVPARLLDTSYRGADTLFTFAAPDESTILATRTNDGSASPREAVGKPFILSFGQNLHVLRGD